MAYSLPNPNEYTAPDYILNGVQSYRWVKPSSPADMTVYDKTDISCSVLSCRSGQCASFYCSQDGCPPTTQAFYALTETGDVYVTTPNGVIYYLASGSNKDMKVVFPTNHLANTGKGSVSSDTTGITMGKVGRYGIQFSIQSDPVQEDPLVRYEQPRVFPWRPGSDMCTSSVITTGERAGLVSRFIIGDPSGKNSGVRPKCYAGNSHGSKLVFPYSNGYYCVQTDHNKCVVFYRGEEIYNGEYSGYGIAAPFGYGLKTCISSIGCNPTVNAADIKWSYSLLPEWSKTDDGHFIITTEFDRFVNNNLGKIKKESNGKTKITGSNILIRREDKDRHLIRFELWEGYFAEDIDCEQVWETLETMHRVDWGPRKKFKGIKDMMKRRYEQYEPGPAEHKCDEHQRRFNIWKIDPNSDTGLGEYVGYVVVYVEREHMIDEGRLAEIQKEITEIKDWVDGLKSSKKELEEELTYLEEYSPSDEKIGPLETAIEKTKEEIKTNLKKLKDLEEEEEQIRGPEETEDCVTGEFHEIIRLKDEGLQNKINDNQRQYRVWWCPSQEEVWCGKYADELRGVPAYACSYKAVYQCNEEETYTYRNPENAFGFVPSSPPRNFYWYVGNGQTEGPNSNFYMSRWRVESCVSCDLSEGGTNDLGISVPPCPCLEEKRTGYTSDNNCLFQNHDTENAAVCGKCNYPVDLNAMGLKGKNAIEEPCWKHSVGCPPEKEGEGKISYKLAHYCRGEVGRVELDNLGGRIHSIFYEDGTESDWAYVNKGETSCRTKKDYTIVGEIKKPEDLPGIYNYDKKKKMSEQRVDVSGANAVILRAPSSKCKEVTIDGEKVCEGDVIDTCTTSFPRGNDWFVRRTITNKKTKKIKCFNFHEINPITGFKDGKLDGSGFDDAEVEESPEPCYWSDESAYWTINPSGDSIGKKRVVENGKEKWVWADGTYTFKVPIDPHGNCRGDYANVEVTAVEKTLRIEVIKDKEVGTLFSGTTTYTWSLNEVGKDTDGIKYSTHMRPYLYGDIDMWGQYSTPYSANGYKVQYSRDTGGYGTILHAIEFDGRPIYFKSQSARDEDMFVGVEESLVAATPQVLSEIKRTGQGQVSFHQGADTRWPIKFILDRKINVPSEEDKDVFLLCRYFTHEYGSMFMDIDSADVVSYAFGFPGMPKNAGSNGEGDEYESCLGDFYDVFRRYVIEPWSWGETSGDSIKWPLLETTLDITLYTDLWDEVAHSTYTAVPLTSKPPRDEIVPDEDHKTDKIQWLSDGTSVAEESEQKWRTDHPVASTTDSGNVIGVIHYDYDETKEKKLSDENTHLIVKFSLDFKNECSYHFDTIPESNLQIEDPRRKKMNSICDLTSDITLTGDFTVVMKNAHDDRRGDVDASKSDLKEVRYRFMRFYPVYLTRPDYYFKLNDAESDVTKKNNESEEEFIERLKQWCRDTDYYKAGEDDNDRKNLPSASPNKTCEQVKHYKKYYYADSFYTIQQPFFNPDASDEDMTASGYGINRPPYKESKTWKFVGYSHEGNEDEDSNENGDTKWYAKWQLTDLEDIIVKVPMPKPQGRCWNKTMRHLSRILQPKQGVWYCTGPAGSEQDALDNYLGSEIEIIKDGDSTAESQNETLADDSVEETTVELTEEDSKDDLKLDRETTTTYDEFSGIKWVQCVHVWGDPEGVAIRAGSMVGDIYHCTTTEDVEEDTEGDKLGEHKAFEDFTPESDRYWYWNGFQWVDGDNYFSNLGTEKVIFYKNEGELQEGVGDADRPVNGKTTESGECYTAKAIFIGKATTKACGNVLAINLNSGLERHAAIFYKAKPIWDRPANSAFDSVKDKRKRYYTDGAGKRMEELMVCVCNAFTLLTYSIGENKQMFRLWSNAAESEDGYSAVFNYDDVPNLDQWRDRDCAEGSSIRRDAAGNMIYPDYMILHSRSGKKLYLFYKNSLLKVYQPGEWYNKLPFTGINDPGSRGPSVTLVQTGPSGGDCCEDVHLQFTGISSSYCVPCDIWLDGSLYRRFAGGRVFGNGVATAVFGGLGIAATAGDVSLEYLGYDILQLTGLGKTFVVPHHMGITFISSFAGYSSPSDPKATSVYVIPDTPGLPGVLGEVAPWAPVNRSMDVIRRGWCFFTTEFNGSDKAAIKGYNIWDVTMSELRDLWYKKTTFTSPCGCKGIAYLVQSAGHAPLGATGPTNAKSFWAASRYFYRPISSYASSENYDSDPMSSGDSRQALMWEKLWEDYGYKDKKVSDVFRLGCAGACIWDYADLDNAPFDEPDFTYTYNNKTRYCKYYDHGNTFPGFASNAYSNIYEDGSIIWGVSFIFGGHRDYAEEWDWVSTGATSSSVEATICGKTYQCDDLYYDALLSDRTKIHDINCTYYLVVLKDNKWHIVDTFGNVPANRCFTSNAHPYTHDLEYTGGKLLLQSPENPYNGFVRYDPQGTTSIPGDILVPLPEAPSEPDGMYIAPGHETTFLDCEGNDFIEYEEVGRHDNGSDHYIDYSIYDKHGQAISGCAYKHCYETELFYSQHHDIAYAIHGSKLNRVGPHGIAGSNDEKYDLYIVRVANAGQVPGYLTEGTSSVAAIITGPTADGLNIVRVVKTNLCHGQGHQGLLCSDTSDSYTVVYEGTVEDRGGILHKSGPWAVLKEGYGFATHSRTGYAFWQIAGDYGIVIRIKNGELSIANETVPSPCKESKIKYRCGKYTIGINYNTSTKKYNYYLFYKGIILDEAQDIDDEDLIPKFAACCGSDSSYVILTNGNVYYNETRLGSVVIDENHLWGLSCCGMAALFTGTVTDGDGRLVSKKQILLIEGKPVSPFIHQSSEHDETNGDNLESAFSSAMWKKFDVASGEPTYSLSCCGVDYYLLQRGDYVRKHEPTVGQILEEKTQQGQYPITEHIYTIPRKEDDPDSFDDTKTFGILEDGTRVVLEQAQTVKYTDTFYTYEETGEEGEVEKVIVSVDKYSIEYPLVWTTCKKDKLYNTDFSPLTQDEYKKMCGDGDASAVFTEDGVTGSVYFYHDKKYTVVETGSDTEDTHEIKEELIHHIPWKTKEMMAKREAFVYYKTELISTDPRVKEITCFRYHNDGSYTAPDYHGIAAYAVFYDDPFNSCYERSDFTKNEKQLDGDTKYSTKVYTELPAVQNILGVAKVHKARDASDRVLVNTTPPTMEMEYLDDNYEIKKREPTDCNCLTTYDANGVDASKIDANDCFCAGKGRMTAVYPNVCMKVWHKNKCMTKLVSNKKDVHKKDTPYIPFWNGKAWDGTSDDTVYPGPDGDKTIIDYRNEVIYINDLNAAGRWDRVSGDDPVDEWEINWPYTTECAGFGGFWLSAPDYHPEKHPGNEPLDPDGRLIVSGNNTLFVFDKKYGMMAYDILTGKRLRFK